MGGQVLKGPDALLVSFCLRIMAAGWLGKGILGSLERDTGTGGKEW